MKVPDVDQLVCLAVADAAQSAVSRGSHRGYFCAHCGGEVWISPSGVSLLPEKQICCSLCILKFAPAEMYLLPPSDEVIAAVEEETGLKLNKATVVETAFRNLRRRMERKRNAN